jgi:hypothetical protein
MRSLPFLADICYMNFPFIFVQPLSRCVATTPTKEVEIARPISPASSHLNHF